MSTITAILLVTIVPTVLSLDNPLVTLPNGRILGTKATTQHNTPYLKFEGIPYAAPPVGKLRFKAPQPVKNWSGVLNATNVNTACYQIFFHIAGPESENCLYLNVYTPERPTNDELPVMLFIHGGGFVLGSSFLYGPEHLIDNDVVVVTINYRLGIFGFLSTEDAAIPGNYGLKDALAALKWTHKNIELFGGDPNKVTIFGESSGAAAVAYMLLNKDCRGLFRGAIMQSGTFLTPGTLQRNAREAAYKTAASVNSTIDTNVDSQTLLNFLQNVDASVLNREAEKYFNMNYLPWNDFVPQELKWAPVIEPKIPGALVTDKMYDLLKAGDILKVPTIIGFNSEEAIFLNPDPETARNNVVKLDENLAVLAPYDMQITDFHRRVEMGRLIRRIYTGGEPFANNVGDGIRYASDNYFTRAAIKHAELSSKFADTYFYQFSYDGELGKISTRYNGTENVGHTEDLYYLFCWDGSCASNVTYPRADLLTRKRLLKLWTNFAKYLNPTPRRTELFQNVVWPKVSTKHGDFLYLDIGSSLEIKNHPKKETYRKWTNLYDSLETDSFDTY